MKKCINNYSIAGILYEHELELRTTGEKSKNPGSPYIRGTISVATDDSLTNIVKVHYTYVSPKTSKGTDNNNYKVLSDIINGIHKTYMDANDQAAKVRIDASIGVNDFYIEQNGQLELISDKRAQDGFIHITNNLDNLERNKFDCDIVIVKVIRREADEENNVPEKGIIKGYAIDFKKSLIPVEFSAIEPKAIDYFESLEPSQRHPVFTRVWGKQISEVIVKQIVTESAFGPDSVRTVKNTKKDWVITGAIKETYEFDDESTMTKAEFDKAIAERDLYLADIKKRREEYKPETSKAKPVVATNADFDF